jgi:translation initiation factor IF-1
VRLAVPAGVVVIMRRAAAEPARTAASGAAVRQEPRRKSEGIQGVAFLHRESRPNTNQPYPPTAALASIDLETTMAKEELIQFEGSDRNPPDARYRAARRRTRNCCHRRQDEEEPIKTLAGDRVTIEMSPLRSGEGPPDLPPRDERPSTVPRGGPPRGGQFRRR